MQRCSSSAMHSEGQRLPRFFVLVFLDIQTGKPPGSRHESLPSHDAPGDFLFYSGCTNLPAATSTETLAPHNTPPRNGSAFSPGQPCEFGNCPLTHAPQARQF